MNKIYSLIPARAGSKGIKNKNIVDLCGLPLISYSIISSLKSTSIQKTFCSTDSSEIAKIAKELGCQVPFLRPKEISEDYSTDFEVFEHFVKWLESNGDLPDAIIHLRPTSPVRSQLMIDNSIKLFKENDWDSLRSVIETRHTPYKMWFKNQDSTLSPILESPKGMKEAYNLSRQILPKTYLQAANIDIIRVSTILEKKSMTGNKIGSFEIPRDFFCDIDTEHDLFLAQEILKKFKQENPREFDFKNNE